MIPTFPTFGPVPPDGKELFAGLARGIGYNSDFSFLSLWTWAIERQVRVSLLNDNLVVRFRNALDGSAHYSFTGFNRVADTAGQLLQVLSTHQSYGVLPTIPEEVARHLPSDGFVIGENRDQADYLYDACAIASYAGRRYAAQRQHLQHFMSDRAGRIDWLDLSDPATAREIEYLSMRWRRQKEASQKPFVQSLWGNEDDAALRRLMSCAHWLDTLTVGVRLHGELVAFLVAERQNDMTICHFAKANTERCKGGFVIALNALARRVAEQGCAVLNYQEDLGIPSLRTAKERFRPIGFARKYTVRLYPNASDLVPADAEGEAP